MYEVLKVQTLIILDSSMVEHSAVNRVVVGSSPVGPIYAAVAELADAQDLKSCCSDTVPVRFRSAAFIQNT